MTQTCAFGGCPEPPEHEREHIPTGNVEGYCWDHVPDADGETWRGA